MACYQVCDAVTLDCSYCSIFMRPPHDCIAADSDPEQLRRMRTARHHSSAGNGGFLFGACPIKATRITEEWAGHMRLPLSAVARPRNAVPDQSMRELGP